MRLGKWKAGNDGFIVWTGLSDCRTVGLRTLIYLVPLTTGPVTSQLMIETSDKTNKLLF